ncbi:MAG TPA: HAMP domain-containing protein [Thioalkalivibrio sp.]|nr:HAMP domain-containing protein [Thioalkalivibrio sp.]
MNSLRARFFLWLSISLIAVVALAWVGGMLAARTLTETYIHTRLEHDAENLLLALDFDTAGRARLDAARIAPIYQRVFSGHYFVVVTPRDTLRSRSLWDETISAPAGTPEDRAFHMQGPQDLPMLALLMRYEKSGQPVEILIAEDVSEFQELAQRYLVGFGLAGALLLLLLLALLQVLVRHSLRPVRATVSQLRAMQAGEREVIDTRVPDEIAPLTREINNLNRSHTRRLERSRTALGNLAHAIKTPLALARQSLQDLPEARRRDLDEAIDRIDQSVSRELKRARLAGGALARHRIPTRELLQDLAGVLDRIHGERALRFDIDIPTEHVLIGDAADLSELFGNALDNAAKWARHRVRVRCADTATRHCIYIEDDGPGIDEAESAQLLERGARLDENVPGHGLGLAIMQDIVKEYGGELALERSALGGLGLRICLPRQGEGWA